MHEMSYCEGVLEAVVRRAAGRPVARVGVRIGAVHRVVPAAFEQSFQLAASGGPAEGARTVVVVVPVSGHCMDCRSDFEATDASPACPSCGSLEIAAEGGDEVILEWLEYAEAMPVADVPVADPPGADLPVADLPVADRAAELVPAHSHTGTHRHTHAREEV